MRNNAASLPGDLPVLWVADKQDKVASKVLKRLAYDKMVGNPKNRFVIVDGGQGYPGQCSVNGYRLAEGALDP